MSGSPWLYPKVRNKRIYQIYKATSPSGKVYIGYTSRKLKYRKRGHYRDARNDSKIPFHRALRKYKNNVKFEVIAWYYTRKLALKMEMVFIKKYDSSLKGNGYNVHNKEFNLSNVYISKQSREESSRRGVEYWKNNREDIMRRLKIANKNNKVSKKAMEKSIVTNSKAVIDSRGCIYYSLQEAADFYNVTESNIRASIVNGYSPNDIKFSYYNDGNFVFKIRYRNKILCLNNNKVYATSKIAAQELGLSNRLSINRVCRGERNHYNNYRFEYIKGVF